MESNLIRLGACAALIKTQYPTIFHEQTLLFIQIFVNTTRFSKKKPVASRNSIFIRSIWVHMNIYGIFFSWDIHRWQRKKTQTHLSQSLHVYINGLPRKAFAHTYIRSKSETERKLIWIRTCGKCAESICINYVMWCKVYTRTLPGAMPLELTLSKYQLPATYVMSN